ncbi:hypothetical protein HPP92_003550 [Vanilla planifolia]|uniref:Uncharacterized protein n=1 Tax=Vanilla planifolia TaxID=51239 RepID=A0A835SGW4_VANPL|nr:hypothetical protein HPP92_003550 [Vanilla planifolia]
MVRVIAKGDGISVYSRTSSLQGWLADSKRSEPLSCAANIAAKLMKFHESGNLNSCIATIAIFSVTFVGLPVIVVSCFRQPLPKGGQMVTKHEGIHLKYHIPDNELQGYAVQAIDMLQGNASTDAHALACVLYILRVGAIEQMMEGTQRNFLVHLAKKLESAGHYPSAAIATLRTMSYLLTTLGEVPSEFKEIIDDTVVAALSHSSLHVRIEAALTMRALAEVDPTSVGGLISYGVTTLYALRESATNGRGNQINNELFSLHGQATVIAALISISPNLSLGYPMRMPKAVLEVSKKMLTEFSRNPTAATVEMESGWLLLASIVTSMPKEELEDQLLIFFFFGLIHSLEDLIAVLDKHKI